MLSLPNEVAKKAYRDQLIPPAIFCTECGSPAPFMDDHMIARYECVNCKHSMSADFIDEALAKMNQNMAIFLNRLPDQGAPAFPFDPADVAELYEQDFSALDPNAHPRKPKGGD